jgi:hypothetical protein
MGHPTRDRWVLPLYKPARSDHIGARRKELYMRAETERTIDEIKQAIALLRRHL